MAFFNKAKDIKMPKIDFFNNEKKEKSAAASTADTQEVEETKT